MNRRRLWEFFVAAVSIGVAFLSFDTDVIAAGCLFVYGAVIGYRAYSPWFYERTTDHSIEFSLFTTLLLITALADIIGWI
jgi:hypothetical protein